MQEQQNRKIQAKQDKLVKDHEDMDDYYHYNPFGRGGGGAPSLRTMRCLGVVIASDIRDVFLASSLRDAMFVVHLYTTCRSCVVAMVS